MILALLVMVIVRFMFWASVVIIALVLAFAACLGVIASGIVSYWNEEHAADLHEASSLLMHSALHTAMFADAHRRWLLPNPPRGGDA